MSNFTFETAPRIICEEGSSAKLGEIAKGLGISRAMIVTDQGLVKAGVLTSALESLKTAEIEVTLFSDVLADPPEVSVEAAVRFAQEANIDGVIGLGGGSSMDTAKLVALLAGTPQALPDIYGIGLAKGPRLPLIQVPTTAGTGSEVTPISILTTPTHEKKGVVSPFLYPDVAVLDGNLTLGLPPKVTAMTGIDAMVHAIEAYTTKHKKNPLSDALAIKALQLLYGNIRKVIADGGDSAARSAMLQGSMLAGMAFANAPVAAVHALAYPLGGHYHVPHGLSNALVLVPVLKFNCTAAAPLYAELAEAIGLPGSAEAFVEEIAKLVGEMPFEQRLAEVGVEEKDLSKLAEDAFKVQRLLVNNPREVTLTDALAIYTEAY
jgi:alcohol dehydrogenase class IV